MKKAKRPGSTSAGPGLISRSRPEKGSPGSGLRVKKTSLERGRVEILPVTAERWGDLKKLFGSNGACAGCWCMFFRLTQSQYYQNRGQKNRRALQRLVASEEEPGLLAYVNNVPAAWCAVAPREEYGRLARSKVCAPVDDQPTWSVTCFFVDKQFRGRGLTVALLREAVKFARRHGAEYVEGYPIDASSRYADTFAYVGLAHAFQSAGFREVARRTPTRPLMRIRCR
jgi:GNAT superfamily N-acetyltransferase